MGKAEKLFFFSVILRNPESSLDDARIWEYYLRDSSGKVGMTRGING